MTTYQVLILRNEQDGWKEIGVEDGYNADAAAKRAFAKRDAEEKAAGAEIVAVPIASWKPTTIKPKTQDEQFVLGEELPEPPAKERLPAEPEQAR